MNMTKEELIQQANRISDSANNNINGTLAEAKEFLKTYAGSDNAFLNSLNEIRGAASFEYAKGKIQVVLKSFINYVENDLLRSISLEREIQIETVSDYLEQAQELLNDKKVHPAAPAVIIGASLEEFLRNWLEQEDVDMTKIKLSLDSYAKELKSMNLINKQDFKDITSWGGTRNDAAHGQWENVEDRKRIKIMLDGVNLFIRSYSK